ncbi:MAG: SGNH/GDSL hydrolase family protein [Tabrizicola sp.]|uniref:SGNH/GDSL hydrolase family protein n=1 Tax=Tabrizicola sp. TaxID=2005166 RepID=UPI0027367127|nr:SGNH/GDSL hydrolase family protein [Tabrizicola sp.]MDP3263571.1 SGNH/GDSL hydrolase family protein [Tabrizicola sp.]MDP3649762.1 SGNH/GDSL hydrolase family protein [Paracoccaceae bacterium]MDZ4070170.1 SGNH/GDSL hydrolase family protein [Tabrizicola sp.]
MRSLLLFGDSNTHGSMPAPHLGFSRRYPLEERWAGRLAQLLPDWEVINEGHPGRTTVHDDPIEGAHRNGMTVLPALLETHRPLDAVLIMLGTNDLKPRFSVNAGDIALGLERIIGFIRAFGAGRDGAAPGILLVAPPPVEEAGCLAEMFAGGAAKSRLLASRIKEVADRTGVAFMDAGELVTVSPIDGVHYGPEANPVLAEAFAAAVRRLFG